MLRCGASGTPSQVRFLAGLYCLMVQGAGSCPAWQGARVHFSWEGQSCMQAPSQQAFTDPIFG